MGKEFPDDETVDLPPNSPWVNFIAGVLTFVIFAVIIGIIYSAAGL